MVVSLTPGLCPGVFSVNITGARRGKPLFISYLVHGCFAHAGAVSRRFFCEHYWRKVLETPLYFFPWAWLFRSRRGCVPAFFL
jgi:hypothetical protein